MADQMRWRYGDSCPVVSKAPLSATDVEIGDLTFQDTGSDDVPKPASDFTWDTNLATTQESFHDEFLGVSGQRSRDTEVEPLRHNSRGVHEFDCVSATFDIGDLVGPAKATGNALLNQTVVGVATANLAIGRVVKQYDAATTKVLVEIVSTVIHGGPQAAA